VTPTIDDGGFVLWESSAVLQYLGRKHPSSGLLPKEEKSLALVQQWLAWEGATLAPSLLALFFAATKQPEPVAAEVETAKAAYLANLRILDDGLAGREFLAGSYSVADIACGALVPISFLLGLDLTGFRNIIGWLQRLRARPAWQRADAVVADLQAGEAQLG
jgi:glutathione S-transferase